MTSFWRNWLTIWSGAVALFGLILCGAAFEATDGVARTLLAAMGDAQPEFDRPLRFAVGLMGAVTFGWGMTLHVAFGAAHRLAPDQARPVWAALTIVTLIWYVVDSAVSIAAGFALNAVSNTVFVIAYLIPVLASGVLTTTERDPLFAR